MTEAEDALKASLELRIARTNGSVDEIEKDIAIVYNNIGNLSYLTAKYNDAIEAHKSALEIREKLAERNPDAFEVYLGYTYVNLGAVFIEMGKYSESVELIIAAKEIFQKLTATKPDPFEEYLSRCHDDLGVSYTRLQRYEEAEEQFRAAQEIRQKWAENNPSAHESLLAECLNDLGRMYYEAKRYPEAEVELNKAFELYKKIVTYAPDAFKSDLARCSTYLGELYKETKRFDDATVSLDSAIQLYEKYKEANPAYAEKISDVQRLLDSVIDAQSREGALAQLTPEEKAVAILLTDRVPQREIIRKLSVSAEEVTRLANSAREKMSGMAKPDFDIDTIMREHNLTQREVDVFRGLLLGKSNAIISRDLILSPETVRIHVRNLLKKLAIENRQEVPDWFKNYRAKRKK